MKIAAASMSALVLAAAAASATPTLAQSYRGYSPVEDSCRDQQHQSGTSGALIGGVAGALLGSTIAGQGNKTAAAAVGAVAGALLGNSVGRSQGKSSDVCQARDQRRVSYRGYDRYDRYSSYAPRYAPQRQRVWTGYDPYSY